PHRRRMGPGFHEPRQIPRPGLSGSLTLSPRCKRECLLLCPHFPAARANSSAASPPRFRLHPERYPRILILIRDAADESLVAVRPVRVSEKRAQHGPAEELPPAGNLQGDGGFRQPP